MPPPTTKNAATEEKGKAIANKDLSCLRCRKKKAKCSKTRPTCARCARSNQECVYPDAPPNLTDLSQTVLSLYDTLRHLEGEMLNQYMEERENNVKKEAEDDDNMALISNRNAGPAEIILSNTGMNNEAMDDEQGFEEKAASSWSLSFTHLGLSLQAAVHNVLELENFLKDISGGIFRGFDVASADNSDHDSYSDDEELDDSEYLVTIPVCRFSNLVSNTLIDQEMDTDFGDEEPRFTNLPFNLFHEHTDWKRRIAQKYPPHVVLLVEALESFIVKDTRAKSDNAGSDSTTSEFVYLAAATIIFASNDEGENPADERALAEQYCVSATNILFENTFSDIATNEWLPIIQAILVLGWYEFVSKRCLMRARQLVVFAIRVFLIYQSQRNPPSREWQIAVMSLVYLDVLSSACMNRRTLLDGDNVANISRQLLVKTGSPDAPDYFAESLYMEFQSIRLLRQVIRTFYAIDDNETKTDLVAKVDVDEVLNLVKDVEKWETDLPPWALFESDEELASLDDELSTIKARCMLHAHALHNVVKVLLFRPFCTDFQRYEDQTDGSDDTRFDQTHTHTTFLDLSMESALKIARCYRVLSTDDFILVIGKSLVEDVIVRVQRAFESDEDMMRSIKLLQNTLSTH
ncbi:hypothetical protein INT44_005867 [Umbelopsis vinacea]|uniref:Zn(2)-C6 fungal-type domain-containing protein n=1 Tax=Umbelopsis vinacea TaxID=44442 RepID=A0A8H7UEM2_9FUNG|nr:hypothetical protein INT44_005867 [Umbelopsis vinacea]